MTHVMHKILAVWPPQEDLPLYVSSDHHVVLWSLISREAALGQEQFT